MYLIKEAQDGDALEQFCGDINLTVVAAGNYLAAWVNAEEMGIVLQSGPGADEMIQEMWELLFDPTLNDSRYSNIDHATIEELAREAGLQGATKAKDIAKNTKSMKVAIMAEPKAAQAAIEAVTALADEAGSRVSASRCRAWWTTSGRRRATSEAVGSVGRNQDYLSPTSRCAGASSTAPRTPTGRSSTSTSPPPPRPLLGAGQGEQGRHRLDHHGPGREADPGRRLVLVSRVVTSIGVVMTLPAFLREVRSHSATCATQQRQPCPSRWTRLRHPDGVLARRSSSGPSGP